MSGMFRKIKNSVSKALTESEQGDRDAQKQAIEIVNQSGLANVFAIPNVKITKGVLTAAMAKDAYGSASVIYSVIHNKNGNAFYRARMPGALVWIKRNLNLFKSPAPAEILRAIIENEGEDGLVDIPAEAIKAVIRASPLPVIDAYAKNAIKVPEDLFQLAYDSNPQVVMKMIDYAQVFDTDLLCKAIVAQPAIYIFLLKKSRSGKYNIPDRVARFMAINSDQLNHYLAVYRAQGGTTV